MANVQIPNLPVGGAVTADNLFEAVQTGTSVRVSAAQIATYVQSSVFGSIITVPQGGTGAASLTGYVFGSGTAPLVGVPEIPLADIDGAGTAASKNMAIGSSAPAGPSVNDLWVDTSSTTAYDPAAGWPVFSDPQSLIADTVLSYSPVGNQLLVTAGMPIITSGLLSYVVADAAATDADITTAGGVKLYASIQPPFMGYSPIQFGAVGDGVSDDTAPVRAAAAAAKREGVGLYNRIDQKFLITDPAGVWFGSDDCTSWVRGAEIFLIAAFNGGTLFDLTGINNGGRDKWRLYATSASGYTPSYAVVQARPKQPSGVKSSGSADIYCNIVGSWLASAYCSVESESNTHRASLMYNAIGISMALCGDDYFKDTFRLPISGASGAFTPGGILTGATSGATATILRVNTARTMLFCRRLSGTFQNGEVVTGSLSGSTATTNIPTGYVVTGVASPNASLGIEEASTASLQEITDCWFNNALGDDLFPTIVIRGFNDVVMRAPNINAATTGDLIELQLSCAGFSCTEPYWHSNHRTSLVLGDLAYSAGNQVFDSLTISSPKFAGNPSSGRIVASRSNVQLNNCNIDINGAIDLGAAAMNANNRIRLRNNSGNPASFTASGIVRGVLEVDAGATINITSPQNSNKLQIYQLDTGLTCAPRRPTSSAVISSDAITMSYGPIILVDTEGAAATDTLSTINVPSGFPPNGMTIRLRAVSASRVVTVSITGGNIRGAANVVLDSTSKTASLYYDAVTSLWYIT